MKTTRVDVSVDVPTHALGHHGTALINHTPMKTTRVDVSVDVPTHALGHHGTALINHTPMKTARGDFESMDLHMLPLSFCGTRLINIGQSQKSRVEFIL